MRIVLATLILTLILSVPARAAGEPAWIAPGDPAGERAGELPSWIWLAETTSDSESAVYQPKGSVWCSRTFEVPQGVAVLAARLTLAADDSAVAYVNGQEVLICSEWSRPVSAEVQLVSGANTLNLFGFNDGTTRISTPAGFLARLTCVFDDGRELSVATDGTWRGANKAWKGWPARPAPGSARPMTVFGPPDTAPWKLQAEFFHESDPCPLLRRGFDIDGTVTAARVKLVGLGHYQLRLNGQVVGKTVINQAWSQYDKTLYLREFDVTPLIQPGENVLGVLLGNSFWNVRPTNDPQRFAKPDAMPDYSQGEPFLLWLEASVVLADGRELKVTSDGRWKWIDGPLTFSNIYGGEDYDARRAWPGWDRPGFVDDAWSQVRIASPPAAELVPLPGPGIETFQVFRSKARNQSIPGKITYVFPQNCSALLRFTVTGEQGRTVRFKPCEVMDLDGRVLFNYTWGTGKEIWHDYTLAGGGPESHQILFCYVGCQYVEVSGAVPAGRRNPDGLPVLENLELVHTRAANREVGKFSCSSDLQNRSHALVDWAIRSNMSHVSTDCPHREKNGWQEQNWHMARSLSYLFDIENWFAKIAHDIRDTQLPDGHIPTNCPNYLVGRPVHGRWNEAPEWGISGVLVPWHLYEWYGNSEVLRASYDSMKRYLDYLATKAVDGVIESNLGDWHDYFPGRNPSGSYWTPTGVSATAIWALGATALADAAELLGKPEDSRRYRKLYAEIREAFLRHFYDPEQKVVKNQGSCQGGNAVALCAGLIPEPDRRSVVEGIIEDLQERKWQQTTGEVLHVFLIRALAEAGRGDLLHRIYSREEEGSYGHMVQLGLTTLPESWAPKPGKAGSLNHFMFGHLVEWHFAHVAGIRQQPGSAGWRKILIAPDPGPLEQAQAEFDAPTGRIASRWEQSDGEFVLTVEIPPDVEAEAVMPDGSRRELTAGTTTHRCELP